MKGIIKPSYTKILPLADYKEKNEIKTRRRPDAR